MTNETTCQGIDPAQPGSDRTVKHLHMGSERVELVDWNELSRRGLLERINREILHPLGLAVCRDVESGHSLGALVSPSGAWAYSQPCEQHEWTDFSTGAERCYRCLSCGAECRPAEGEGGPCDA